MNGTIEAVRLAKILGIRKSAVIQMISAGELNAGKELIPGIACVTINSKLQAVLTAYNCPQTIEDIWSEVNCCRNGSKKSGMYRDSAAASSTGQASENQNQKTVQSSDKRVIGCRRLFDDPHSISERQQLIGRLTKENSMTNLDLLFLITPKGEKVSS